MMRLIVKRCSRALTDAIDDVDNDDDDSDGEGDGIED